jgi:UDP-glucose:(heptosyl)LPS alpha-1,3-glucosyltransferase
LASAAEKATARQALKLPTAGALILFVANDFQKKGLQVLLNAFDQLLKMEQSTARENPPDSANMAGWGAFPLNLAVVGNAVHAQEFSAQIKRLGLESRVFFLGQLENVAQAYQAADVLAHPTLEDTFGMVVLEAMAHGLPVVVSAGRYCGIAELLAHDINALVLQDPTDAPALARELASVLTDGDLRARLETAATAFANNYKWSYLSLKQEIVYKKRA